MNIHCDIFCAVIDNLGDAGVCWRLARQLAREHGWAVRLWIDDVAPLAGLQPGVDPAATRQQCAGVAIRRWENPFPEAAPGDVVIEAFACTPPEHFIAAMARKARPPVWINLEYLSAEDWVESHHGLSSPHPRLPLTKYFYFPGFTPRTGGLLRERAADFGGGGNAPETTCSLFCYDNPALPRLLNAWAAGPAPLRCLVAAGLATRQVAAWAGASFAAGDEIARGALRLVATPFVSQDEFDRRLAACDLNLVRGEDSFVRAQWARRPFVWQIYPQADDAHHPKLNAFLDRYTEGLASTPTAALRHFWQAWNNAGDVAACWPTLRAALPALARHAAAWEKRLVELGDLAGNLARFCEERL